MIVKLQQQSNKTMSSVFGNTSQRYKLSTAVTSISAGQVAKLEAPASEPNNLSLNFVDPETLPVASQEQLVQTFTFEGTSSQTGEFGGLLFTFATMKTVDQATGTKGKIVHMFCQGGPSTVPLTNANNHFETTEPIPDEFRPRTRLIAGLGEIINASSLRIDSSVRIRDDGKIELQPDGTIGTAGAGSLTTFSVSYLIPDVDAPFP